MALLGLAVMAAVLGARRTLRRRERTNARGQVLAEAPASAAD
jgi:hypothetical protein